MYVLDRGYKADPSPIADEGQGLIDKGSCIEIHLCLYVENRDRRIFHNSAMAVVNNQFGANGLGLAQGHITGTVAGFAA